MKKVQVCIIILNWNGLANTKKCLASLLKITNVSYKIFVIDNGSKNNEASLLSKQYQTKSNIISVLHLQKNLGFTGGCNYGIMRAKEYDPDFYLLLNNDTTVDKNFLKYLLEAANADKTIGIASPVIYNYYHKRQIIFSGGGMNWLLAKTFHKTNPISSVTTNAFITGCCFLIKKELINTIGPLDNRFFAYFEDAAYSIAARKAHYTCICVPKAKIFHIEGASSDKKGSFRTYLIARNRILFINNYTNIFYKGYFFVFNVIKLLFVLFLFIITNQKKRSSAYLKGYLDGTFGKGGLPRL